jgi:predicted nuclease of predicted toxin-antitoxin system
MKILLDMNLPPAWVDFLENHGIQAIHWSNVGSHSASDKEIMTWAKKHGYIVFTHDLDFGAILAASKDNGPSVIQVRTQNVMPNVIGSIVVKAINEFMAEIQSGALISIDVHKSRVRILPFE